MSFRRAKDFHDTQFEYRWKSEWSSDVCTVEIRPTGDTDVSGTIPEIDVSYSAPHSHDRSYTMIHGHTTIRNAPIGKLTHVYVKPTHCETVEWVFWKE